MKPIIYSLNIESQKVILIYLRVQHVINNTIQGTKDIIISKIDYTNKFDTRLITAHLASNNFDLFALTRDYNNGVLNIKGKISINTLTKGL